MAHFYGDLQGSRGEATRCGTKQSGITGHVRGWNIGARVSVHHEDGIDYVTVYRTGGSNAFAHKVIATFDTTGSFKYGDADDPAQRLRDAMSDAIAAGIDVWPILADETFRVRT